eukprot:TRINITY_DN15502_c0_g1_i1.p1 TRINITY_DN15502_c0_g1~~TRINITY_DN15502_c0_g1_i1.p1  ORF type:complete len:571 (+),score=123.05 TRINITY_DN15502_c0_g1_i1:233-1945(+)
MATAWLLLAILLAEQGSGVVLNAQHINTSGPLFHQDPEHLLALGVHPSNCTHHFIVTLHHKDSMPTLALTIPEVGRGWQLEGGSMLVAANHSTAVRLLGHELVRWVGLYPSRAKVGKDSLLECDRNQSSRSLAVMLAVTHNLTLDRWAPLIASSTAAHVRVRISSSTKVVVTCECPDLGPVVRWLSHQPSVIWVERLHPKQTHNLINSVQWVAQSGVRPETPITNQGVLGEGETLAVADTGLDYHNCYFADEHPVPSTSDPGTTLPETDHRKVRAYLEYMDQTDAELGHGTYTAGAAVGSGWDASGSSSSISAMNANAPGSRLVAIDLGCTTPNQTCTCTDCDCTQAPGGQCTSQPEGPVAIHPPDDWNARLFPFGYAHGARVFLAAFGDVGSAGHYNLHAMETDKFVWEHQEFLPVLSTGPYGVDGLSSLVPTATSKNALVVGASGSDYTAFEAAQSYRKLETAGWEMRDFLILQECGPCTNCSRSDCELAKKFRPYRFRRRFGCCQHPLSQKADLKAKCCPGEFKAAHPDDSWGGWPKISLHNLGSSGRGTTLDGRIKPDVVLSLIHI